MQDLTLNLSQRTRLTLNLSQNKTRFSLGAKLPNIKTVEARINTVAYWTRAPLYVPAYGTIIIYSDYTQNQDGQNVPALKIGDGSTYLVDLPFVSDDIRQILSPHVSNLGIHTTASEKQFWNNKLNCDIINETLIFNRN